MAQNNLQGTAIGTFSVQNHFENVPKSNTENITTQDAATDPDIELPHPEQRDATVPEVPTSVMAEMGDKKDDIVCRICFGDYTEGTLIQPCKCKGTQGHVHRECLAMWLQQRWEIQCDICKERYQYSWYFLPRSEWSLPDPVMSFRLILVTHPGERLFVEFVASTFCEYISHHYLPSASTLGHAYWPCFICLAILLTLFALVTLSFCRRWITCNMVVLVLDKQEDINVSSRTMRWMLRN